MKKINSVSIKGFRSLADVELTDLPNVAVMVGANGSGKSNFLRFFEMLQRTMDYGDINRFVQFFGGADDQLFRGAEVTQQIKAQVSFGNDEDDTYDYRFDLDYVEPNNLVFSDEAFKFWRKDQEFSLFNSGLNFEEHDPSREAAWHKFEGIHSEAEITKYTCANDYSDTRNEGSCNPKCLAAKEIANFYKNCNIFHFHNTSNTSGMKISWDITDRVSIRSDGGNIAAVLMSLEQNNKSRYNYICRNIRRIFPNFDTFDLTEEYGKVILRWKAIDSNKTYGAHLASDGSLRFFALVTLLNLPDEMLPEVIFLDEPELGLHPAAVALLGGMLRVLSEKRQVFIATQSPLLVDAFSLENIFALELQSGKTAINRFSEKEYLHWLEEYSTGELWDKNLIGGYP